MKNKDLWFIAIISFVFFLLRLPSLFEPLWYGDEGIYQGIGIALNNGKLLYQEIFDNKPPLLYLLYALFNSDQFGVRLISLIFGFFSVIVFFMLSKKLFKDKDNIIFISTSIFALFFGIPLIEGNIANAENFMLLPILASAFIIINEKTPPTFRFSLTAFRLPLAGLLLSIAFLFKIVAVFDFLAFLIFLFITNNTRKLSLFIAGFLSPIILVSIFFILQGGFGDFFNAAFLSNISYVNYGNKVEGLPILLFIKGTILIGFIFYVFNKRKLFDRTVIFILIWLIFSIFNALFSSRPYTHYVLVLLPTFSLIFGLIFYDKKYRKILTVFILVTLIIVLKNFNFNVTKSILYYQNFISFLGGFQTASSYSAFFDRNTPRDYEIARYIKPKLTKNDTIFIWGNNAQIYKLTNTVPPTKYIVAYHISNYKDGISRTERELKIAKPKFIIVMPNTKSIPFALLNYSQKIIINNVYIYERTI